MQYPERFGEALTSRNGPMALSSATCVNRVKHLSALNHDHGALNKHCCEFILNVNLSRLNAMSQK
jgi:hypothetical protein